MAFCGSCGREIKGSAKFCTSCGAPVGGGVSAEASDANVVPQPSNGDYSTPPTTAPVSPASNAAGAPPATNQPQYSVGSNGTTPQGQGQANTASITVDLGSDHTSLYSPDDISRGKIFAIGAYLLGFMGIIIALLAARDSKYAMFHTRESMKIIVANLMLGLITLLLIWTVIVPMAALVCFLILGVVQIICIVRACQGKAKKAPIIGSFKIFD